jgi:HPt (histidine-containing phosphotransfer) domain-containing protein
MALDPGRLVQLRATMSPERVEAVFDALRESVPAALVAIEEAVAAGDTQAVGALAHGVRGNALTVGALQLADSATEVQQLASEGRLDIDAALERLRSCWQDTVQSIEQEIGQG